MTDSTDNALKPCPFCGNDGTKSRLNLCNRPTRHAGWEFTVECTNCGADGPYAATHSPAAKKWNHRADLAPDPLRAVKVRALVWECTDWSAGDGVRGENDCEWTAEVWPLTSYIVSWFGGDRFEVCTPVDERLKATSLEAAKAAAQADYETRIRSALEPCDPLADARVAALVETAKWARNRLETIADENWRGDARDFKRSLVGVFADFDAALAALSPTGGNADG